MQYVLLLSSDQQLAEQLQPFCPEQWQRISASMSQTPKKTC